jgi:hypothetical protein
MGEQVCVTTLTELCASSALNVRREKWAKLRQCRRLCCLREAGGVPAILLSRFAQRDWASMVHKCPLPALHFLHNVKKRLPTA